MSFAPRRHITDGALVAGDPAGRSLHRRPLPAHKAIDLIMKAAAQAAHGGQFQTPGGGRRPKPSCAGSNCLLAAEAHRYERVQRQEQRRLALEPLQELQQRLQANSAGRAWRRPASSKTKTCAHAISEADAMGSGEDRPAWQYDQLAWRAATPATALRRASGRAQQAGEALLREQVEEGDNRRSWWPAGRASPMQRLWPASARNCLSLENRFAGAVIAGQAVGAVAASIRRARAGSQDRDGRWFLSSSLGPTGVGKTGTRQGPGGGLFDEEEALVRLDMSEFMGSGNRRGRTAGRPSGYVGLRGRRPAPPRRSAPPYAVLLASMR